MLKMRYPFGISREVSTESPTVLFRLGDHGQGEGAPVKYKKQKPDEAVEALAELAVGVTESNMDDIDFHDKRAMEMFPERSGALAAFNIALWDARGRKASKPVYQLIGASKPTIETTYTVSLSDNDTMELRAREVSNLPLLKVKLGRDEARDLDIMQRIRKVAPKAVLRVDANAGWSYDTAKSIIPKLADLGVEFIEQPLAIGNIEETSKLHKEMPLPIVVDEDAQYLSSLDPLRGHVAGINIKLDKCGGISESLRMIDYARREGWQIMVGCMLETRLSLGAACHIASLVDAMDVDAHMLTTNDPFPPGSLKDFSAALPLAEGPGIGLPLIDF